MTAQEPQTFNARSVLDKIGPPTFEVTFTKEALTQLFRAIEAEAREQAGEVQEAIKVGLALRGDRAERDIAALREVVKAADWDHEPEPWKDMARKALKGQP
jgi:hypothetical protein